MTPRALWLLLPLLLAPASADAARLKDIARWRGVQENALVGQGLVVGLAGTGDGSQAVAQFVKNMNRAEGGALSASDFKAKNAALVTIIGTLPPFARVGDELDVTVAAQGDARSLAGGVLVATNLYDTSGQAVWAVAQGPLTVGGFSVSANGSSAAKNHVTTARVPGGARVSRELAPEFLHREVMSLSLDRADFTTAVGVARALNKQLLGDFAHAVDSGTVDLRVPPQYLGRVPELLSAVERIEVGTDTRARVVINERTGTVVMGQDVRIATVALAHAGLTLQIDTEHGVSQPGALSGGVTQAIANSQVHATEEGGELQVVGGVSIGEVVGALNQLGVAPRDLISILQAIHSAGAMDAELTVL